MGFSEALKLRVKKRAHFACCLCKGVGVEVHHIVPQEARGPDTEANAAPLCPSCHETYGANPIKRKFLREARDAWYEICDKRFAPQGPSIEELSRRMEEVATIDDLADLKEALLERLKPGQAAVERNDDEIVAAVDELVDKVWYNRHQNLRIRVKNGEPIDPSVWKSAKAAARKMEAKYPGQLGPWSDFEWGMLNGKLSALRWVLGDEWDFLDT